MWQILTIAVLLVMMVGLQSFDVQVSPGEFNPKSLAATGFIILAAFTTGELFKRFKIPALLGYIIAGIAFGPNLIKMVMGPQATALFDAGVITDLALINVLAIGVIGTMGGGELKISDIKDTWKTILVLVGLIVSIGLPLTIGLIMALVYMPGEIASFLGDEALASVKGQQTMHRIAAALLFGILTGAMSPAVTLAISQESKAKGKFTSMVLGIVVVGDLVLVALFLIGLALAKLMTSPEGFSVGALVDALPAIGLEFAWALVIGAVMGGLFIVYIRYIKREMMLFTVAIIFAGSYVCKMLHAETLLAFLTAGFIVQNASRHGHDLIHELEKISLPVFIIYFMTQAAQLDLTAVLAYLPLTLIWAALRAGVFYGAARLTTNLLGSDETAKHFLWISFLSVGGVDLILAAMVADNIALWGKDFQTVIMATVVIHIIVGPPLLKYALSRAGETEEGRQERAQEAESLGESGHHAQLDDFLTPALPDPYLNGRLLELRQGLIELHLTHIEQPMQARHHQIQESLEQVRHEMAEALKALTVMLDERHNETPEQQHKALIQLHTQSRRKLQPWIRLWEHMSPTAFDGSSAQRLIDRLRELEDFESLHIVELEEHLHDAQATSQRVVRMLRRARRVARALGGPSRRSVPLGRLWRYYVELAVPRLMASRVEAASSAHEVFWHELEHYLHGFDEIFYAVERLILGEPLDVEPEETSAAHGHEPGSAHAEHHAADHQPGHEGHEHEDAHDAAQARAPERVCLDVMGILRALPQEAMSPYERAQALVRQAQQLHQTLGARLLGHLDQSLALASQGYSWSLRKAYEDFVEAASCAGTLELPSFLYQPSKQYNAASRAEQRVRLRLEREAEIVRAYVGWLVVDHQLTLFVYWFEHYQTRIVESLEGAFLKQLATRLERLQQVCARGPQPAQDPVEGSAAMLAQGALGTQGAQAQAQGAQPLWTTWRQQELEPATRALRMALERALLAFGQGTTSRRLIDALEYRVARISEEVTLLVQDPAEVTPAQINQLHTMTIKIRAWFSRRLVNEIALQFIDFNDQIDRIVRRKLMGLDELEQVLEFNLTAAQREHEESGDWTSAEALARGALERATKELEGLYQALQRDVHELERWVVDETTRLVEAATEPFMAHELRTVQQELARMEAQHQDRPLVGLRARLTRVARARASTAMGALAPLYEELIEDVRLLLREEQRPQQRAQLRALLGADEPDLFERLPPIYRRLFNPVPLDLPEFYIDRGELEKDILEAIAQWGRGRPTSVLLFGDRGVGKRTLIHNLVPIQVYDLAESFQNTPIQTIRLSDDAQSEAELCQQLWPLLDRAQPRTFKALRRRLLELDERQIVVIENATRCYSRTARGFALCEAFMEVLSATSERVLWVLVMESPAAILLDTMVDLFDYFTHVFELEPMSASQLEQLIMRRHRVSGFSIRFERGPKRLVERLSRPVADTLLHTEPARRPQEDFFKRLAEHSAGNPLLAMLMWLRAVQADATRDNTLRVSALGDQPPRMSDALTLRKKLILSLLLQHGTCSVELLAEMLVAPHAEIFMELEHMRRLGLVEPLSGVDRHYQLRDIAAPVMTRELRQINLS